MFGETKVVAKINEAKMTGTIETLERDCRRLSPEAMSSKGPSRYQAFQKTSNQFNPIGFDRYGRNYWSANKPKGFENILSESLNLAKFNPFTAATKPALELCSKVT